MRGACIDIGSNTTRLLVAECDGELLLEVHQERVFTHIGRGIGRDGAIGHEKIGHVATVVAEAVTGDQFLILPHPEVAGYYRMRAGDTDRWLAGMNKMQRAFEENRP